MVCSRCSSNLYPAQPGTSTAARDEPSAGNHQALRETPSVLRSSISLYASPTDAGVIRGDLRRGEVIQSNTRKPTPKYASSRVKRRTSMRRSTVLTAARVLEEHFYRSRASLFVERDCEGATLYVFRLALNSVGEDALPILGERATPIVPPCARGRKSPRVHL